MKLLGFEITMEWLLAQLNGPSTAGLPAQPYLGQ